VNPINFNRSLAREGGVMKKDSVKKMGEIKKSKEVREMEKRTDGIKACSCGHNRWQAVIKGKKWKCRKCGKIREV
jgi:hypothetical protein